MDELLTKANAVVNCLHTTAHLTPDWNRGSDLATVSRVMWKTFQVQDLVEVLERIGSPFCTEKCRP